MSKKTKKETVLINGVELDKEVYLKVVQGIFQKKKNGIDVYLKSSKNGKIQVAVEFKNRNTQPLVKNVNGFYEIMENIDVLKTVYKFLKDKGITSETEASDSLISKLNAELSLKIN